MLKYANKLGLEKIDVLHDLSYDNQDYVEVNNLPNNLCCGLEKTPLILSKS